MAWIKIDNWTQASMYRRQTDDEDAYLEVMRLLDTNPHMSQREIAAALGVSLGKANYCLKALLDKGWLKMQNFQGSTNKLAYAYLLTPKGIVEKSEITARFLKRKMHEYESLRSLIESLQSEVSQKSIRSSQRSLEDKEG